MCDESVDLLSGLAPLIRVKPEIRSLCSLCSNWGCAHEIGHSDSAAFHIVISGSCEIGLAESARSIVLQGNDLAVLPHGSRHVVRRSASDASHTSQLVCGHLRFEQAHRNLVLSALPEAIVVRMSESPDAMRMCELIAAIRSELEVARPGGDAIARDLGSALFVMVLRAHLERERVGNGLLSLLAHKQAGRAVGAMLEDLAKPWTLDDLALRANASRASLVRMFQKSASMSPLQFLAQLRLDMAKRKLAATRLPLIDIAAESGYQSESAFSRAFRRRFGMPPGEARFSASRHSSRPAIRGGSRQQTTAGVGILAARPL
jgi:AraC family transcriptional activator of mtrCDE